jgi:hypothetical protein
MRCQEVRNRTSEYIDRRLGDPERGLVEEHLGSCVPCRGYARNLRDVGALLRELPVPAAPPDFFDRALVALERETSPPTSIITPRRFRFKPRLERDLLEVVVRLARDYDFKLIAYSVGLFISFGLFSGLLASMRPLVSIAPFFPKERPVWIEPEQAAADVDSPILQVTDVLPRIAERGGMTQYAIGEALADNENLMVIAEIAPDGRVSILQVPDGWTDSRAIGELACAINRPRSFVPPRSSGRAVPTRVVLFVEHVNVIG